MAGVLCLGAWPVAVGHGPERREFPYDLQELWQERTAIMVYDGELPPAEATRLAWAGPMWIGNAHGLLAPPPSPASGPAVPPARAAPPARGAAAPPERPAARRSAVARAVWTGAAGWDRVVPSRVPGGDGLGKGPGDSITTCGQSHVYLERENVPGLKTGAARRGRPCTTARCPDLLQRPRSPRRARPTV